LGSFSAFADAEFKVLTSTSVALTESSREITACAAFAFFFFFVYYLFSHVCTP
jgi:hypothetical protein